MKITAERIALAVLAIIIIVFLLRDCSRPSEQKEADRKQQYETELAILKADKAEIQSRQDEAVKTYQNRLKLDSINIRAQDSKIQALKSKLANQRPKVIEKIQADTAVLSYVNTLEETVSELQVQNDTLKSSVAFHKKVNEDLILAEIDEDKVEASMNMKFAMRVQDLEKLSRRKEKRSKLAKVLIPIVGVAGLLVGASL